MSSRALRKLQQEKEASQPDAAEAGPSDDDISIFRPAPASGARAKMLNPFDLVILVIYNT